MASSQDYKSDFIVLLEAGFIAVNQADEDSARKLFKAAEIVSPENILPKVGLGYLHLHKLELTQASQMFKEVLEKEPNNEMAKALLGVAMSLAPTTLEEGKKLLHQSELSDDKMINELSHTAMNFVNKFLIKDPTPMEGKKKHE